MKARHIFLLTAMIIELILFFYCFIRKSNHVPAGYICGVLSLVLFVCTGWLLLFPKVTPVETTGKYKIIREDSFYIDTSRLETYNDDGGYRELPVSFWYPDGYDDIQRCPLVTKHSIVSLQATAMQCALLTIHINALRRSFQTAEQFV